MTRSTREHHRRDSGHRGGPTRLPDARSRVVGLGLAPFAHQLFKLRVGALGQHDAYDSKQIALALLRGKALAFEAEGTPRAGAGRNGELDRAVKRRHAHLGADRKSTRLNSSHSQISYAVFCLKKKNRSLVTGAPRTPFALKFRPSVPQEGVACS